MKKLPPLPEEVRIVLECFPSTELPCKKFRRANIFRFVEHLNTDKCQQCISWFRQTDKELKTMALLAEWQKSRNS